MSRLITSAAKVYGRLLRLCSSELYAEFGEEIALVFADDLAGSMERGGALAALGLCFYSATELGRHALSNLLSIHGVLTSLIVSALTIICFSAELALARVHGPTLVSTAPAYVAVIVVLIPGIAAAFIAFIATRLGLRSAPQRFLS